MATVYSEKLKKHVPEERKEYLERISSGSESEQAMERGVKEKAKQGEGRFSRLRKLLGN
jgi:hypothetical protein